MDSVVAMDVQRDFESVIPLTHEDINASYVPASYDDYLVNTRMRHTRSRPDTNSKLQSAYDEPSTM
jgi:hypothetical protein